MSRKKAYYFQHDCNAREDEKLIALRMDKGAAGYGIYFMLLELLSQSKDCMFERNYNKIGFTLKLGAEDIKPIVENYGLFQFAEDGKLFYSERLKEHMGAMQELSETRSRVGKLGGRPKSNEETKQKAIGLETETKQKANAHLLETKGEDIKGEEKKEDITFSPIGENVSDGKPPDVAPEADGINYQKLIAYWNDTTKGRWGKIESIDNNRRKMVRARIAQHGKKRFIEAIEQVVRSEFLSAQPWFNFDWLIRPNNFDKVISGNFDNKHPNGNTNSTTRTEADRRAVTKPTGGYETDF